MALNDWISGHEWSGYKAPSHDQTNPNNDPEIEASQARLRAWGQLTPDQYRLASAGDWVMTRAPTMRSGDNAEAEQPAQYHRRLVYHTPAGVAFADQWSSEPGGPPPESPVGLRLETEEKFWWQPGLAEKMDFEVGQDGKIASAAPRNTRQQGLGGQIVDFAGGVATLAAMGLASYGLAYGLGAAAGGASGGTAAAAGEGGAAGFGVGGNAATGMAAGEAAGAAAGTTTSSSAGTNLRILEGGSDAVYGSTGAGEATASSGIIDSGSNLRQLEAANGIEYGSANPTGAPSHASTARSAGSTRNISPAQNYYETLFGGSGGSLTGSGFWDRVAAGAVSQAGSYLADDAKRDEIREETLADRADQRAYDQAKLNEQRAYETRNMSADKMVRINWTGLQTVTPRPNNDPVNPYSAEAPPTSLNTPRLPLGPIAPPVIDGARDIYERNRRQYGDL